MAREAGKPSPLKKARKLLVAHVGPAQPQETYMLYVFI